MPNVAALIKEHVTLAVDCVDRLYLNAYVPRLQSSGGVVTFLEHRGQTIPSPALFGQITEAFKRELRAWAEREGAPWLEFGKGVRKDDVVQPYRERRTATGATEGVVLVGVAQEKASAWRATKQVNGRAVHFTYSRTTVYVNYYAVYFIDREWGPGFLKACGHAPYALKLCLNGHEWAKRQLATAGIAFTALDNGLRDVEDPAAARRICARLSAGHLRRFLERWLKRLPSALTPEDHAAGFRYEFSIRQLEISDTAVFDRPAAGRAWFEAAIRDHLDLGRPEQVRLIVNRKIYARGKRRTPGRFETRIITRDVDPQLQIHYRSSKVKAYFKEQRALRVETTINDPRDFGVGRRLCAENWTALRRIGAETNARFLAALGEDEAPPPDATTLEHVVLPSADADGLRAPGLRLGDPRVMALLGALASFCHVAAGLTNAGLCRLMTGLLARPYTARQATYDLRRLRRKGFIERLDGRHVYRLTPYGQALACFLTKVVARVVVPTLTELEDTARPATPRPIVSAWRSYERAVEDHITASGIAA